MIPFWSFASTLINQPQLGNWLAIQFRGFWASMLGVGHLVEPRRAIAFLNFESVWLE
jgi:hypothetical protein